jgi:hypothetical protein
MPVLADGEFKVQHIALWVERGTGHLHNLRVVASDDTAEESLGDAIANLVSALCKPWASVIDGKPQKSQPGLPARVLVDSQPLADAARNLLSDCPVEVERVAELPDLDETFAMVDVLWSRGQVFYPEEFSWDVDPALLSPLYESAKMYAQRAPWRYLPEQPPIEISMGDAGPREDTRTFYACVTQGEPGGMAFYFSVADLDRVCAHVDQVTQEETDLEEIVTELGGIGIDIEAMEHDELYDAARQIAVERGLKAPLSCPGGFLAMYFTDLIQCYPSYLKWLERHRLPIASEREVPHFWHIDRSGDRVHLDDREVSAATSALKAINGFVDEFHHLLSRGLVPRKGFDTRIPVRTPHGERALGVRWLCKPGRK